MAHCVVHTDHLSPALVSKSLFTAAYNHEHTRHVRFHRETNKKAELQRHKPDALIVSCKR